MRNKVIVPFRKVTVVQLLRLKSELQKLRKGVCGEGRQTHMRYPWKSFEIVTL